MASPVVWIKVVSSEGPTCCPRAVAVLLHGAIAAFLLLRKEPELCNMFCGTVVLFGKGSLQCQTGSAYVLELAAVFSPETEGRDSVRKIDTTSVSLCLCLCSFFLFLCLLGKDRKYTTTAMTTHLLQCPSSNGQSTPSQKSGRTQSTALSSSSRTPQHTLSFPTCPIFVTCRDEPLKGLCHYNLVIGLDPILCCLTVTARFVLTHVDR